MPEDTKYTYDFSQPAADIDRIEAGLARIESALSTTQGDSKDMADNFSRMAQSSIAAASSNAEISAALSKMADYYTKAADSAKHTEDKTRKMQSQFTKGRQDAEKMVKAFVTLGLINTKLGRAGGFMSGIASVANRTQSSITGMDLSLGGIVKLLVDAYNIGRKISGLAKQAAVNIGGGKQAIYATKTAMFDLRKTFAMDYEEAGKIVNTLTSMGFAADELSSKSFIPKDASKSMHELNQQMLSYENDLAIRRKLAAEQMSEYNRRVLAGNSAAETSRQRFNQVLGQSVAIEGELDRLKEEEATIEKRIANENERARSKYIEEVGLAKELTAIQVNHGISVQTSAGLIKDLRQNYGKTGDEARGLLGTAISYGKELAASGVPVGIGELLDDWSQIIQYTKVYKTDLLGVMGMYDTFIRNTDTAKALGIGALTKEQKMDVMKGLAKAPLEMDIGWKVRFGKGRSPVERMMEFENLASKGVEGFAEMWQRVVGGVQQSVGDIKSNPAMAEFRAREMFRGTGMFQDEDTVRQLSKDLASGKLDAKNMGAAMEKIVKAQDDAKERAANWSKDRLKLVKSASEIAVNLQTFQEILKKWLQDFVMSKLNAIIDVLYKIADLFGSDSARKKLAEKGISTRLGGLGAERVSPSAMVSAAETAGVFTGQDWQQKIHRAWFEAVRDTPAFDASGKEVDRAGDYGARLAFKDVEAHAGGATVGSKEWVDVLQRYLGKRQYRLNAEDVADKIGVMQTEEMNKYLDTLKSIGAAPSPLAKRLSDELSKELKRSHFNVLFPVLQRFRETNSIAEANAAYQRAIKNQGGNKPMTP